ncbi:MAG: glycosyltransferase [Bacteroidia bacterium]
MKIGYLSTFYPYRGGIAQYNARLFRAFEKNHEVKAFNFSRQYPEILFPGSTQLVTPGDKVDEIPNRQVLDSINPFSWYSAANKINRFQPAILVEKFWMSFFGPSLGTVNRKTHKKGVINIAILDNVIPHERRFYDKAFTQYYLNSTDGFIVMSETVKRDLLSLKPDAKYVMHPHPVYDHFGEKLPVRQAREKLNIPADRRVLLFFGLIRNYKGLDLLLNALANLPGNYHLIVAGEPYGGFDSYQRIIDENHLSNRLTLLTRYINDDEVPAIFSASDVCILPYRSATQSGIMYTAYHFETPLIVTDVGSLRELVAPFGTGSIVSRPDAVLITEAIKDFYNSGDGQNHKENIREFKSQFSWDNLADKIVELGESILERKS